MYRHNTDAFIQEKQNLTWGHGIMTHKARLLTNLTAATLMDSDTSYGLIENAAIVIEDSHIRWVGQVAGLPTEFHTAEQQDMGGRLVTPGLIDCHTHVVHGGNRALEFEMRLNGASYEDVARAGGGIVSTVSATRAASEDQLLRDALRRVDTLIAEGITTIEIKSGYGLDTETELRMLRVARAIMAKRPVRVITSFLGAHATPPEFKGRDDAYIDEVCIPTLRAAHAEGLVDAVDGFCEGIAFSTDQIARVFDVAKELDLPIKLHAEQLSNLGGAALAARYGAMSADHIEYLDEPGVKAMAVAGTVAVLLPGAYYTLHETQTPPVQILRKHGVPMALATDANPGSSPLTSLLMAMNMGCTLFRMTPQEAMRGVTVNAARALGIMDTGLIAPYHRADLAVWDIEHPAELSYRMGFNPLYHRIYGGLT